MSCSIVGSMHKILSERNVNDFVVIVLDYVVTEYCEASVQ